jgi:hypothetical protein
LIRKSATDPIHVSGHFGEGARPDKIGVVVTPKEEGDEFVIIGGTPVIIVSCENDVMSEMYGTLLAMAIVGRRGGVVVMVGPNREGVATRSTSMVAALAPPWAAAGVNTFLATKI